VAHEEIYTTSVDRASGADHDSLLGFGPSMAISACASRKKKKERNMQRRRTESPQTPDSKKSSIDGRFP
jgi:hypothetical protein